MYFPVFKLTHSLNLKVTDIIPISSGCSCHYRECAECRRAQRGFQPRNDVLASRAANFRGRATWQAAGRLWFSSDPQFGGTPGAEYGRGFEYRQFAYCHQFHWPCPIAHPLCAQLDWLQYNILITKYIMRIASFPVRASSVLPCVALSIARIIKLATAGDQFP